MQPHVFQYNFFHERGNTYCVKKSSNLLRNVEEYNVGPGLYLWC